MPSRGGACSIVYEAYNTGTSTYQTGDSANHTIRYVRDGVEVTPTNSPAEVDSTNAPGAYVIALTSGEATANVVWVGGKSSTASVLIISKEVGFENLPVLPTTLLTAGSGVNITQLNGFALQSVSGFAQANLVQWEGVAPSPLIAGLVQATFSGTTPAVNVTQWLGNGVSATTAGIPDINILDVGGVPNPAATGFVGVDWSQIANQGSVVRLTHTTISGITNGVNVTQWSGAVVAPLINGLVQAVVSGTAGTNVLTWLGSTPNALTAAGNVQADVEQWRAVTPNTLQSGRVDATVGQVQPNAIGTAGFVAGALTTTVFGAPFLTSASYDTTYSNGLADALGNRTNAIEVGLTPYQSWQLVAASQGGVLSGALTPTVVIDGAGVATTRITATCDSSGNRLAVVLSL